MKIYLTAFLLALFCVNSSVQKSRKLKVSLYYEALCPYSSMFVIKQLYPVYQKIGPYLVIDLVPYGDAERNKVNGTWHFDCQHGPPECALNKIQACGLSKSRDQDKDVAFVNCVENQASSKVDIKEVADSCAPTLGLTGDVILTCANGKEGSEILAHLGERTDAVDPPIQGVPTICFNNKNNETLGDDARSNFLGTACKLLHHKPKACPNSNGLLKVSVYYESMCPYSIKFIKEQLYPTYIQLNSSLQLHFVPYGRASHSKRNGKLKFRCQHGKKECWGNKAQACGLEADVEQDKKVEYVNCLMSQSKPPSRKSVKHCAPKLGVTLRSILKCVKGTKGDALLAKYGEQTHLVDAVSEYGVPTVVFNDNFDKQLDLRALKGFLDVCCDLLPDGTEGCPSKESSAPLKVSIYYESLCPDSVRFITRQLYPAYQKIGSALSIDFVPYGKAFHEKVNGTWKFECQHGPNECWGNKAQACGLLQGKEQSKNVDFVNCVMDKRNPAGEAAINECAPKLGMTGEPLLKCSESEEASELLAKYGDQTHAVDPTITFVPTIIFNDKYDTDVQDNSLRDFLRTACRALPKKPDGCPADLDLPDLSFMDFY